ncbi:hydroxyacylglutathione hydrolase [Thioclava sp. FR2]|uniref:hydroxyacylglutathione hydrolase n=1 Tax=Thioclava sp. FR2 TaxID=3445780 RepID=UPI003EBBBF2C
MPLELVTIPCLKDNYVFLLHNPKTGETAVVDVPEAPPILSALRERGWTLTDILLTHHHWDHIDGVADLVEATGAKVTGAEADRHRLPPLDRSVKDGDTLSICDCPVEILDVSGHTVGHIAYSLPAEKLAFTGDSLMAGGCGRLFEGTPAQMWQSLSKLAALPSDTLICSGHEYTASNLRFALTLEPDNPDLILRNTRVTEARAKSEPTVPSLLSEELATNPFLRAGLSSLKAAVGMENANDAESFAEIRARKDKF